MARSVLPAMRVWERDQIVVRVVPVVADVGAGIDLDEADAALDQPPRQQALAAEVVRQLDRRCP